MFTNAHCYSCVAAYELFRQYNSTNPLSFKTVFVFYHITQPGVEDSIYFENRTDSDARNVYYGSHNTAPLLFMDGTFVGTNTKTWQQYIESQFTTASSFEISVKGSRTGNTISIESSVSQTGDVAVDDLRIHVVLTESVETYVGKNGVNPQVYAMRKMLTGPNGESLTITKGQTKKIVKSGTINSHWVDEKMFVVVFLQSASKKTVYQSEMRSVTFFNVTSVKPNESLPAEFSLGQNYPNPFNPSTTIEFTIAHPEFVTMKVFDILGNHVETLVKENLSAGKHTVRFEPPSLSSGLYYYTLQSGSTMSVRKMLLLK